MLPPAPVTFSTMTDSPRERDMRSAMMRAMVSVAPHAHEGGHSGNENDHDDDDREDGRGGEPVHDVEVFEAESERHRQDDRENRIDSLHGAVVSRPRPRAATTCAGGIRGRAFQ